MGEKEAEAQEGEEGEVGVEEQVEAQAEEEKEEKEEEEGGAVGGPRVTSRVVPSRSRSLRLLFFFYLISNFLFLGVPRARVAGCTDVIYACACACDCDALLLPADCMTASPPSSDR